MEVGTAVDTIRDNLKDGFLDAVTADELRENTNTLQNLSPEDTNEAISQLSDADLEKWTDELHESTRFDVFGTGGLSIDERSQLYTDLARDLNPTQLERFYHALGDENRQSEFIDSVATHATNTNKVELIARLADQTTDGTSRLDVFFGGSSTARWDQDARAVSTLIGSLSGASSVEQAIGSLSDSQLESVLRAGTQPSASTFAMGHASSTSYSFDTSGLTAVVNAVATTGDANLKARVFELAARQIDDIRSTDSVLAPNTTADDRAGEVADALANLLESDTVGIITSLERGDGLLSSRTGNGLSSYTAELIRQGDLDTVRETVAKLQAGNDLNGDPATYLASSTTDEHGNRDFQNASNLGFFVGSVREGIGAIQSDADEQAATLNTIFGVAFGLGGLGIPSGQVASKAALVIAKPLTAALVESVTGDLANGHTNLGDAIEQLALPADVYSSDVTGPFGDAIDAVVRN
ncbi:MAG: hypothetical protein AB8B79_03300 [Granulosicoccus sp.]